MATKDELLVQVLALPVEQRAELVEELLGHLEDAGTEADLDRRWTEELDPRAKRVADGHGEFVDAFEHLQHLRAKLRTRD